MCAPARFSEIPVVLALELLSRHSMVDDETDAGASRLARFEIASEK